jgi:hypothetical protein
MQVFASLPNILDLLFIFTEMGGGLTTFLPPRIAAASGITQKGLLPLLIDPLCNFPNETGIFIGLPT